MSKSEDRLRKLERKLDKAVTKLSEAECELDEAREDVREIRMTEMKGGEMASGNRPPSSARRSNSANGRGGIRQVLVERQEALGIVVHLDDRTLELGASEMLLTLIIVLAAKEGHGLPKPGVEDNGYVPMKSIAEILAAIHQRTNNWIGEAVLRAHIARLRKKMARAKIRRKLVETGQGAYRLQLHDDGRVIE